MEPGQPSRTAFAAAAHRAAHQLIEGGHFFSDPLAVRILGATPEAIIQDAEAHPERRRMRMFIAVRTRLAEDALAAAVANGLGQLVVLGAGLDTFAYRNPYGDRLRVFEVDHPATQSWKRQRLAEAGIEIPESLAYAPVDFERESLADGLAGAGFDPLKPAFFTWLGVVPYLTREAMFSTLRYIGSLPAGAHVVFDYSDPPETLDAETRADHDRRATAVRAIGEAWVNYLEGDDLRARLGELGFSRIEDLGPAEIAARYFPKRVDEGRMRGGHILHAAKTSAP